MEAIDGLTKMFWLIAIGASIGFVAQTIMTFIGADSSDGVDADFSGDFDAAHAPFQLFSLRNIVHFLLGFGWGGLSLAHFIMNDALVVMGAVGVGVVFVVANLAIMGAMMKLKEDNTVHLSDMLNRKAEVYLTIPESKKGKGKILISIKGSVREVEAITENATKITSGSMVNIVKVEGNSILIVEPM